jgi:hypothetical protein
MKCIFFYKSYGFQAIKQKAVNMLNCYTMHTFPNFLFLRFKYMVFSKRLIVTKLKLKYFYLILILLNSPKYMPVIKKPDNSLFILSNQEVLLSDLHMSIGLKIQHFRLILFPSPENQIMKT